MKSIKNILRDLKNVKDQVNPFLFPDNIKTKKAKIAYSLFHIDYTIRVGKGQIMGRFTNMIPEFGFIILFIERYTSVKFSIFWIIFLLLASHVVFWFLGYMWMVVNFDRIEQQISAQRNPLIDDIHKSTKKKNREVF